MALDVELQRLLELADSAPKTYELTPEEARRQRRAAIRPPDRSGLEVHDSSVETSRGRAGVRIYRPRDVLGTPPVCVYFHGSGWVICDLDTHDDIVCQLARSSRCVWVSVDYPLAPEAKFPAPLEACYDVVSWAARSGEELGADPTRLAVAGDSAGGNLAAVVCLLARDRGGPRISFQLLAYPVCDLDFTRQSYVDNDAYGLSRRGMEWYAGHYLDGTGVEYSDWRVSPLNAPSLRDLPPALVVVAEYDVLRDGGLAFATALQAAGNDVQLVREPHMNHGFWGKPIARAGESLRECGLAVARALRAGRGEAEEANRPGGEVR